MATDDEIVIVCHCKKHTPIFHIIQSELIPVSNSINYIDPTVCPDDTWDKIADNSKKYVWGINCPVIPIIKGIYPLFIETSKQILNDILINSWRVLKNGGKVVFPGPYDDTVVSVVQEYIDGTDRLRHKWTFSIENTDDFPLSLVQKGKHSDMLKIIPKLAVFTKVVHEGGRKMKRTSKRKIIKYKTKKHTRRHKKRA